MHCNVEKWINLLALLAKISNTSHRLIKELCQKHNKICGEANARKKKLKTLRGCDSFTK